MIRLSKQTDYGFLALAHLAAQPNGACCCAREIAATYGIPPALMAKLLQRLVRRGLLASHHGARGGYQIARPAAQITLREVIEAIEGPMALTECGAPGGHVCAQSGACSVAGPLQTVQKKIVDLLAATTLHDLVGVESRRETGRAR